MITRKIIAQKFVYLILGITSILLFPSLVSTAHAQGNECGIDITKFAPGGGDQEFEFIFSKTPEQVSNTFFIKDGQTLSSLFEKGELVENLPPGWRLADVECVAEGVQVTRVPYGVLLDCVEDGGNVECTFTNIIPDTVPTLSQWGFIAMAGILGLVGFMVIRRRNAAA